MIKIDNVEVFGFSKAISSMRNPYESWAKSDSTHCKIMYPVCSECPVFKDYHSGNSFCVANVFSNSDKFVIGESDMALCKKLIKAGSEHRKFLRMIHVQADVVAPRYWWAEMDKYKYVEANSSSTMHLIGKRKLTLEDFSCDGSMKNMIHMEYAIGNINTWIEYYLAWDTMNAILKNILEKDGIFDKTDLVRFIKQLLPESYNQLRTIDTNYEALLSIYHQRRNHRLSEWSGENGFCTWCLSLPYFEEFAGALKND